VAQSPPLHDSLRTSLQPYLEFIRLNQVIGREWSDRAPEYFAWLGHEPKLVD
jgi:hypothetical protein